MKKLEDFANKQLENYKVKVIGLESRLSGLNGSAKEFVPSSVQIDHVMSESFEAEKTQDKLFEVTIVETLNSKRTRDESLSDIEKLQDDYQIQENTPSKKIKSDSEELVGLSDTAPVVSVNPVTSATSVALVSHSTAVSKLPAIPPPIVVSLPVSSSVVAISPFSASAPVVPAVVSKPVVTVTSVSSVVAGQSGVPKSAALISPSVVSKPVVSTPVVSTPAVSTPVVSTPAVSKPVISTAAALKTSTPVVPNSSAAKTNTPIVPIPLPATTPVVQKKANQSAPISSITSNATPTSGSISTNVKATPVKEQNEAKNKLLKQKLAALTASNSDMKKEIQTVSISTDEMDRAIVRPISPTLEKGKVEPVQKSETPVRKVSGDISHQIVAAQRGALRGVRGVRGVRGERGARGLRGERGAVRGRGSSGNSTPPE